jgi:hypothetical protein
MLSAADLYIIALVWQLQDFMYETANSQQLVRTTVSTGKGVVHSLELTQFSAGWWCVTQHGPSVALQLGTVCAQSEQLLCGCLVARWLRCMAPMHLFRTLLVPREDLQDLRIMLHSSH